jgi:hypothetical protein
LSGPAPAGWNREAQDRFLALTDSQRISAFCHLLGQIEQAGELGLGNFSELPRAFDKALRYAEELTPEPAEASGA